jgi:hypothetical protein
LCTLCGDFSFWLFTARIWFWHFTASFWFVDDSWFLAVSIAFFIGDAGLSADSADFLDTFVGLDLNSRVHYTLRKVKN